MDVPFNYIHHHYVFVAIAMNSSQLAVPGAAPSSSPAASTMTSTVPLCSEMYSDRCGCHCLYCKVSMASLTATERETAKKYKAGVCLECCRSVRSLEKQCGRELLRYLACFSDVEAVR